MLSRLNFRINFILITLTTLALTTIATSYGMNKLPIVYHPDYNIKQSNFVVTGLGWLAGLAGSLISSSDSETPGRIYANLCNRFNRTAANFFHVVTGGNDFAFDQAIDQEFIDLGVHANEYITSLNTPNAQNTSDIIPAIAGTPFLKRFSMETLQHYLLHPMRLATMGTYMACDLALTHGWAINLASGYHHATFDSGSEGCFFADIPYAITKLWTGNHDLKVMIVDLDARQGNGNEDFFNKEISQPHSRIDIFDVYNTDATFFGKPMSFHNDIEADKCFIYKHALPPSITTDMYMSFLREKLPQALAKFAPGLIIYCAGTNIWENDQMCGMQISADGINKRDLLIFNLAAKRHIPIAMVLADSYTPGSADIVVNSIAAILQSKGIR